MTIGMAVRGPGAGAAILTALARLEAVSDGAIGGFVSLAAMTADGVIARAETQQGGARALLATSQPDAILRAPLAVVMSSGPDRPAPLAQFTPGRPSVGLVTGHRFPNALGGEGKPLADAALDLLEADIPPQEAAQRIVDRNPRADAGVIVLGANGQIGLANTALLGRHNDLGFALKQTAAHAIGVLHNSIVPHAILAPLAVHLVERALLPISHGLSTLRLSAGVPVHLSPDRSRVIVDEDGKATALEIATAYHGDEIWSAGLGPDAEIVQTHRSVGHAMSDPFLVIREGHLTSINGMVTLDMPYLPTGASAT